MIEKLKAAYEAATPGEWAYNDDGRILGSSNITEAYLVCDVVGNTTDSVSEQDEHNADFIALAHNTMPALIEGVKALNFLIQDVEAVGIEEVLDDWPDLYETYLLAKAAMKKLKEDH